MMLNLILRKYRLTLPFRLEQMQLAILNGEYYFMESKNGDFADFTKNQKIAYPLLVNGAMATPVGKKAKDIGLSLGVPMKIKFYLSLSPTE